MISLDTDLGRFLVDANVWLKQNGQKLTFGVIEVQLAIQSFKLDGGYIVDFSRHGLTQSLRDVSLEFA